VTSREVSSMALCGASRSPSCQRVIRALPRSCGRGGSPLSEVEHPSKRVTHSNILCQQSNRLAYVERWEGIGRPMTSMSYLIMGGRGGAGHACMRFVYAFSII
jgi:hypothetical protein